MARKFPTKREKNHLDFHLANKKNWHIHLAALSIAALVALASAASVIPADATHIRGLRHFPSANLINDDGKFVQMKKIEYQSSSGRTVDLIGEEAFVENTRDMLTIKMEDVFKIRIQEGSAYKVVDKSRDDNGISVRFEGPGGNDDMNYFIETRTVYDGRTNYKLTYYLNQNQPSYSDEDWWVPLDGRGQIQCWVTVHFTDGTWMQYAAMVKIIGANPNDNPV